MKDRSASSKASRSPGGALSPYSDAGEHAEALTPPAYGIDFVDSGMPAGAPLQRAVEPKKEEEEKKRLQGKFATLQLQEEAEAVEEGEEALEDEEEDGGDETVQGKFGVAGSETARSPERSGLPERLQSGIESLSGMDMSNVRVHANSEKPARIGALAYAQGNDIHLAPGQERHLPHEAWHVVQQRQGRVQTTLQARGVRINDDRGLEREADVMGARAASSAASPAGRRELREEDFDPGDTDPELPVQMQFIGPQFIKLLKKNIVFPGHAFAVGAVRAKTGCGTDNQVTTDGSRLAPGTASKPGTPKKMNTYRGGFFQRGGLVEDPNLQQAATRMHMINHRLENSGNTQRTPQNIFLGSQRTNNPMHLQQVETPVIAALNSSSKKNAFYEAALIAAIPAQDGMGTNYLAWLATPSNHGINNAKLVNAWLGAGNVLTFGPKAAAPGDPQVKVLDIDNYVPAGAYRHLWLQYRVRANYGAWPAYVQNNINVETIVNTANKGKKQKKIAAKIKSFTNDFAPNAFPPTFQNFVTYYYASYNQAQPYYYEAEAHKLNTDN